MLNVTVTERGGEPLRLTFEKHEIVVGRVPGADLVLAKGNVSKRHCRILLQDGNVLATDLQSTNGTYVNGHRLQGAQPLRPTDRVYIGDFILQVGQLSDGEPTLPVTLDRAPATNPTGRQTMPQRAAPIDGAPAESEADAEPASETAAAPEGVRTTLLGPRGSASVNRAEPTASPPEMDLETPTPPVPNATIVAPGGAPPPHSAQTEERDTPSTTGSARRMTAPIEPPPGRRPTAPLRAERTTGPMASPSGLAALQRELFERVVDAPELRLADAARDGDAAIRSRAERLISSAIRDLSAQGRIPNSMDRLIVGRNVLNEIGGLGPLEDLLADAEVSEILVDRADAVQAVRAGRRVACDPFSSERAAQIVIDRLIAAAGARADDGPILDLRLPDGSRALVVLPPAAVRGPALSIRKRRRLDLTLDQLVLGGTLSSAMADLLWASVATRRNVLFSGPGGAGKSTLLGAIAAFVPAEERVVCIEEIEEIGYGAAGWLQFESGALPREDERALPVRDLLRGALRLRPDRIVLGELRGGEALDLLLALRGGLGGALTTCFAASPLDALQRLEALVREADAQISRPAARDLCAATVHLVVHQTMCADGVRRVTQMSEVVLSASAELDARDIFVYEPTGAEGVGAFVATGVVPSFLEDPERRNTFVDENIFSPGIA